MRASKLLSCVPVWRRVLHGVVGLLVLAGGLFFVSVPAFASFSRSFELALPTGTAATGEPRGGIAIDDGGSLLYGGRVWTGAITPSETEAIDEFSASNVFIRQLLYGNSPPVPVSGLTGLNIGGLAFDDLTEQLYTSEVSGGVAVDDSSDAYRGDVYFAGDGSAVVPGSVSREQPVPSGYESFETAGFTCPEGVSEGYIVEGRLVGAPGGGGGVEDWFGSDVGGVAVDSGSEVRSDSHGSVGDVYVINNGSIRGPEVDVFTSEGCFVGAITGREEVKKDGREEEVNLLGNASLRGIAVDPTDGDVLVKSGAEGHGDAVYEFVVLGSSGVFSGEFLGRLTGVSRNAQFGSRALAGPGIAVSADGELYVGVGEAVENGGHEVVGERFVVDVFGPGAYFPGAVTGGVSGAGVGGVTLHGVVRGAENSKEEDLELTECVFEVVSEEVFKRNVGEGRGGFVGSRVVPCSPGLGGERLGERNVSVSAGVVGGLVSGVVYDYRLVAATSSVERGGVKEGEVVSFAAPGVPLVGASSVGGVSSSFADLRGEVDPRGSGTSYQFVYVDEEGVGGVAPAVPVGIGSGDGFVGVAAEVGGLLPDRAYSFRVVARNGVGEVSGGDGVFRTLPAGLPVLPDGRAYELVTPPSKGDGEDLFGGSSPVRGELSFDKGLASEDGNHFLLLSISAFGSFPSSGQDSYVFSRGEAGWSFESAASPALGVQSLAAEVYDPFDFSVLGVSDGLGSQLDNGVNLGLVGPPGGPYTTVVSAASSGTVHKNLVPVVGASADLSRVVVESKDHALPLCDSAEEALEQKLDEESYALYGWSAGRPCLSLVGVKSGGAGLLNRCGAVLGQGDAGEVGFAGSTHDAVSEDGSRVFFTAPDPYGEGSGCWKEAGEGHNEENVPEVYCAAEVVGPSGEVSYETIEVSAPEKGVVDPRCPRPLPVCHPAIYVGASADGSRVFFLTRSELTKEAVALKTNEPELYEYNLEAPEGERLVRVSRGDLTTGPVEGKVVDVPAISADGSTVYFDAEGELTPGASHGGIYRYDTETGSTAYVGPSPGYPSSTGGGFTGAWYAEKSVNETLDGEIASLDLEASYFTTRDGQFFVFGPYRYDAADGSVVCVMCNPDGSGPIPDASFTRTAYTLDNPAGRSPRVISENGKYVFFDTAESLVPQDTNGKVDVYEWEEDGAGSCTEARGCVSLISSGEDSSNSYFFDSSAYVNASGETVEGGNVFFGTQARLVPQDTDDEGDLYDARIDGGFAPVRSVGPCEGDACDNPPPAPIDQTPGSLTFSGTGNLPAQPVSEGKQKKAKKGKKKSKVKARGRGKVKAKGKTAKTRGNEQWNGNGEANGEANGNGKWNGKVNRNGNGKAGGKRGAGRRAVRSAGPGGGVGR
jgi:hypothetical protein